MKGHFWASQRYFFFHSLLLGTVVGTAFFPGPGTILGLIIGGILGMVSGIISHLFVTRSQSSFLKEGLDQDVDRAGRWLSSKVGLYTGLPTTLIWSILFWLSARHPPLHDVIGMAAIAGFIGFWSGLMSAAIARNYPRWLIHRMIREGQLASDPASIPSGPRVLSTIWKLFQSGSHIKRILFGMVVVAFAMLYNMEGPSGSYTDYPPPLFAQYMLLGGALAELFWLHVSIGNGVLMTTLKQLVLDDRFPHLSAQSKRRLLTTSSLVVTLLMSIWVLFFAPMVAFYMASAVHRTTELSDPSDQTLEKAKRKEKNTLALEEPENESEDEARSEERERYAHQPRLQ